MRTERSGSAISAEASQKGAESPLMNVDFHGRRTGPRQEFRNRLRKTIVSPRVINPFHRMFLSQFSVQLNESPGFSSDCRSQILIAEIKAARIRPIVRFLAQQVPAADANRLHRQISTRHLGQRSDVGVLPETSDEIIESGQVPGRTASNEYGGHDNYFVSFCRSPKTTEAIGPSLTSSLNTSGLE